MNIKQVMNKDIKTIGPDTLIREAAALLNESDLKSVLVCDGKKLVGMLTEEDLLTRAISSGKDPSHTQIREIMTPLVHFCLEDHDLEKTHRFMKRKGLSKLPVINRDHQLVGLLSLEEPFKESFA